MGVIHFLERFNIYLTDSIILYFLSFFLPLIFVILAFPLFIKFLRKFLAANQPIRNDGPKSHIKSKSHIPTFGGLLIFLSIFCVFFIIYDKLNPIIIAVISLFILTMILGGVDDYLKIYFNNSKGVKGRYKLIFQFIITFAILFFLDFSYQDAFEKNIIIPIINAKLSLGNIYYIFAAFVIVGSSNSVNLTDGLDGLVSLCLIPVFIFYFIILYSSNYNFLMMFDEKLLLDLHSLKFLLLMIIGALFGFLWLNCHPAKIFMGDVGSLPLGSILGIIAVLTKTEILLLLLGGIFVIEAISVIIQVLYYKKTKLRFFKMAPIHHHFELNNIVETQIVIRFFIVTIILVVASLSIIYL